MDYISERRREMQTTLRVLQAYPESKIDLKPAEKSRTAAELVMILAVEERVLQALMQTGSTDRTLLNFEAPSGTNCSTIFITGDRFPCTCAWQGQSCRRSTAPRQMNRCPPALKFDDRSPAFGPERA